MKITKSRLKRIIREELENINLAKALTKAIELKKKAEEAKKNENFKEALSFIREAIRLIKLVIKKQGKSDRTDNLLKQFMNIKDSLTRGPG